MPKRRIPNFNYYPVKINGYEYLRARIVNAAGKQVSIYGKTVEELCEKVEAAERPAENAEAMHNTPTVKAYCEKWLLMQSAHADHGPAGGKQPGRKKRGGDDGCRRKWKAGL